MFVSNVADDEDHLGLLPIRRIEHLAQVVRNGWLRNGQSSSALLKILKGQITLILNLLSVYMRTAMPIYYVGTTIPVLELKVALY